MCLPRPLSLCSSSPFFLCYSFLSVLIPDYLFTFCYSVSFSFVSGLLALMLWEPRRRPFLALACVHLVIYLFSHFGRGWSKGKYLEQLVHTGFSWHLCLEDPNLWSCAHLPSITALFAGAEWGFLGPNEERGEGYPRWASELRQALKL